MHILIAEDDFTSRTMLAAVLKKGGHVVTEAVNGVEALTKLQAPDAPHLVILDWMMPEMDGVEVLRRVRALETEYPPYLIMLTSKDGKADIVAGLDAGANDYLSKPFDAGELRARVEVGCRMVAMQAALIESRKALLYQATHDPMTGMLNRRAILEHLHKELVRVHRLGEALAIGMCDIDHFKQINDTYGHQTGDDVLRGLSLILNESLRPYDSVGRMGGEEFLVIAPMKTGTECTSLFDRLRLRVADHRIRTRSGDLSVTVSIGVVLAATASTVDAVLEASDVAMYQAKNGGRNCVVVREHYIAATVLSTEPDRQG